MTHEEASRDLRQLTNLFRSVEGKAWISAACARHLADCIDLLLDGPSREFQTGKLASNPERRPQSAALPRLGDEPYKFKTREYLGLPAGGGVEVTSCDNWESLDPFYRIGRETGRFSEPSADDPVVVVAESEGG